jgi:hypothetical protein
MSHAANIVLDEIQALASRLGNQVVANDPEARKVLSALNVFVGKQRSAIYEKRFKGLTTPKSD